MFKKTLPTSINNELIDCPSIRTYDDVLAFCRRRTDYHKELDLCELAKTNILTERRLSAMTTDPIAQLPNETSETWK